MTWIEIPRVLRILRSTAAVTRDSFWRTVTGIRFLTVSMMVGLIVVLAAWRLVAFGFIGSPGASPVWTLGADGSLVALSYGFVAVLLPVVPSAAAYYLAKKDRESAFLETAMTRPVPRWAVAFGRFAGLALGAGSMHLIIATMSVLVIYAGAAGTPLSPGLIAGYVLATLLVGTLYLCLALCLTALFRPSQFVWLAIPVWLVANAIEPAAIVVTAQALLILPEQVLTFVPGWHDWLSFTGLYQGFLAHFVPEQLAFVAPIGLADPSAAVAYSSVPAGLVVWLCSLLFLYLLLITVFPLGRR